MVQWARRDSISGLYASSCKLTVQYELEDSGFRVGLLIGLISKQSGIGKC